MTHEVYLKLAIKEASGGMHKGDGGPFGAVVVRDKQIIGRGHNTVLKSHDPTAHAEINAIRHACKKAGSHHLSGAVLYTNFEPCPMCLTAAYWADIRTLYYCSDQEEARKIGFMDSFLYREMGLPASQREMKSSRIKLPEMTELLKEWNNKEDKILY
jgi:tRNA(Arg) A34 adenosine deaminase TadA